MTMSLALVVELVCLQRLTTTFDHRHTPSKVHGLSGGQQGRHRRPHPLIHVRWLKFQTTLRRVDHARTHITPCQYTHPVPWPILDWLHRMCCFRKPTSCNPTVHLYTQAAISSSLLRFLDLCHLKACFDYFRVMWIDMEAVRRTSRIFQTRRTSTLPFTKSRRTHLNQT